MGDKVDNVLAWKMWPENGSEVVGAHGSLQGVWNTLRNQGQVGENLRRPAAPAAVV